MNEYFKLQIDGMPSEIAMLFYLIKTKEGIKIDKITHSKGRWISLPGLTYTGMEYNIPVFERCDDKQIEIKIIYPGLYKKDPDTWEATARQIVLKVIKKKDDPAGLLHLIATREFFEDVSDLLRAHNIKVEWKE